jgi:preprotein translocase subunit SecA
MISLLPSWKTSLLTSGRFRPVRQDVRELRKLSDRALSDLGEALRDEAGEGDLPESAQAACIGLVCEAARRCLGFEFRENQLRAGRMLLARQIVELPTGEGKTLAVTPALAVRALSGRGVWLATSNDYLARRDAWQMRPVFELLGLSTGYVQAADGPAERRRAYACDITYGTIREFGFDFLRDRLQRRRGGTCRSEIGPIQRELFSIFVDEADSVMLDDARTPLIISEPRAPRVGEAALRWSVAVGRSLRLEADYFADPKSLAVWLTEAGRSRVRQAMDRNVSAEMTLPEAYRAVSQAIQAEMAYRLDRDYVIRDGRLVIIDQSTGRLAEGREWQDGFQQVLQAANGLEITPQTRPAAQITVQAFLSQFEHLSGMTGTAWESRQEFARLYGLRTVVVPPFRPCRRRELETKVFNTRQEKWEEITTVVSRSTETGRPVLIGTRDLHASRELSANLSERGIRHQILTAEQVEQEAELIAAAGEKGMVTVSTNMAGRGTDIRIDADVEQLGGLEVIASDMFDAARIDRQLAGRAGRQGAPGAYQKILSLEDDLLTAAREYQEVQHAAQHGSRGTLATKHRLHRRAQQELERRHAQARWSLLIQDRERTRRLKELELDPCLDEFD